MQNALLNTPVHEFNDMVVEQRGAPVGSSGGGTQRDEGYYERQRDYEEDYNSGSNYDSSGNHYDYEERSERRNDYPDDGTGYNPGYHDTSRDENYNVEAYDPSREAPPEVIYEPAPEPAYNDAPSPNDSGDKERN